MDAPHQAHDIPLNASALLPQLAAHRCDAMVVAVDPECVRSSQPEHTAFYVVNNQRLRHILSCRLEPGARGEVIAALSAKMRVFDGAGSVPALYGAAIVWAECDGELHLWRRGKLMGRFKAGESEVRWCLVGPWRRFSNSRFSTTHGFLSSSWFWRGVCLRGPKRSLSIIHSMDPIVLFDPTYRDPELTRDAGWVRHLAHAISNVTALPLEVDAPLA